MKTGTGLMSVLLVASSAWAGTCTVKLNGEMKGGSEYRFGGNIANYFAGRPDEKGETSCVAVYLDQVLDTKMQVRIGTWAGPICAQIANFRYFPSSERDSTLSFVGDGTEPLILRVRAPNQDIYEVRCQ